MIQQQDFKTFSYRSYTIRFVAHMDEAWFLANDVCQLLDFPDIATLVKHLHSKDVKQLESYLLISELGLYQLITNVHDVPPSRKNREQNRRYKDWLAIMSSFLRELNS